MKTKIESNGIVINISLEPENELEKAIIASLNLFDQSTIVTKSDAQVLSIMVDTNSKLNFKHKKT